MAVVLIVDDSPVDRARAVGLLKMGTDLSPLYASNGKEALALIAEKSPDIVVSDLHMPEMDGLELVVEVRRKYAALPVILMTAHGSEETAIAALRKGATNYVAKRNLARELVPTVLSILAIARTDRGQQQVLGFLASTESHFELDNDIRNISPLLGHLETNVKRMRLCDNTGWMRIAVALREALVNAIFHGNLELTSQLLEEDESAFAQLAERRPREGVFAERRVRLTARETRNEVTYVIRDQGAGFNPATLPDPTEPQNLDRRTGRGLFLIRTFMDEVRHNATGNEITMVKLRDNNDEASAKE